MINKGKNTIYTPQKTGILFTVFLLLNLLLSFAPESGVAAGIGMILFMLERIVVFFVMVIGEGGSGGALALSVGDRMVMHLDHLPEIDTK